MANVGPVALLFVDGYNIIGACPQLTQVRDQSGLESARHQLAESLVNYAAYKDFEVRLIFDAYAQPNPRAIEPITHHLSIHYTAFGETADTYIECWCARLRHHDQRRIVATSDRAQRLTVIGYGAEWMSAHQLAIDMTTLLQQQRQHHQRQRHRGPSPQRFLANSLSPEAQERLRQMRNGRA
ncbi:NYN domain-containing protein [Leptolyngbya sp. PCC 6406]|uniref:NYN domain-containing protein n=1 Tax=Leptolyngbya sp. PCC 6406 TaxID=1173264 RepID=UPI0002ABE93A|nr:NYN domain-containing protein [Leptolyngbya sp. PCC 6406]